MAIDPRRPASVPALALAAGVALWIGWLNPVRYQPWSGFYSEVPAAIALLLVAVACLRRHCAASQPVVWAVVPIAAVVLIQGFAGLVVYRADALVAIHYLVALWISLLIGSASHRGTHDPVAHVLAVTLVVAAGASTGIGLAQWFDVSSQIEWINGSHPWSRVGSNLGQANHFATLCLMAVLATVYLRRTGSFGDTGLYVLGAWFVLGMALAQSRTTWVAVAVLAVWVGLRWKALSGPAARQGLCAAAALVALYAALFGVALNAPVWLGEGAGAAAAGRLEAGSRPILWSQALTAIQASPWFGYGWLQGHTAQLVGAVDHPGLEYTSYFHNLVLDLMVWNGVPLGLLISCLLLAWYIRTGLRVDGPADAFRFAVVTVLGVHSMLEYPFAYLYFIVPVGLLAGQLCRPGGPGDWRWRRGAVPPRAAVPPTQAQAQAQDGPPFGAMAGGIAAWGWTAAFVALVLTWTLAGIAIARDYLLAEHDRRETQMVLARIGGVRPFPPQPDLWVLDQLEASARNARREIRAGMPADELDDLATVTRRYPTAFFLRSSAAAWALNGDPDRALLELRRLRSIHGEPAWQGSLLWLEQTAQEQAWPLDDFIQRARAQTQR